MATDEKTEQQLETEAAEWFTVLHSGEADEETRAKFEAWIHGNRARKVAYREFEQVYRDLDFVAEEARVNIDDALGRSPINWATIISEWFKKPALAGALLLAGAGAFSIGLAVLTPAQHQGDHQTVNPVAAPELTTQIAEIREVVLEDGSLVTLGARSRIETEFTETLRRVTLLEGEAFFEVSKDPNRPFFVAAQDTLVRVVGTKFDVKRSADIVHISVLEGIVEVMKSNDIVDTITTVDVDKIDKQVLSAGERVSAARRVALPQARQVEQAEPGAWRQGRLAYEDASLAEIVADLNRYYDRPIEIAASDVGDLRSTLAFQTADIDQIFEVLEAIHPIQIYRPASGTIILRRKR